MTLPEKSGMRLNAVKHPTHHASLHIATVNPRHDSHAQRARGLNATSSEPLAIMREGRRSIDSRSLFVLSELPTT
jgi:hypothetical protein